MVSTPRSSRRRKGDPSAPPIAVAPSGSSTLWQVTLAVVPPLAALLAYANAFNGRFVFDDLENITNNPYIRQLWPLSDALGAPPQSAVAGRPLVALTLALNYAWGGLAPWGYHAFNLLIHTIAVMLAFVTMRRVLLLPRVPEAIRSGAAEIAAAAALLWAVHPLQTEVVNYVIQRTESLAALWSLAAVYASVRAFDADGARKWPVAAVAFACLGVASKETAVTIPVLVLLIDSVCASGSAANAIRRRTALYGGLLVSWGVLAMLIATGPRFRSAGFASGVSPIDYLLHQGPMIATYLKLLVWPDPLLIDYGRTLPADPSSALPFVVLIGALFLAAVAALRVKPFAGLAMLWLFVCLAPASSIVPIATEVGAERRMYLASLGVAALAAGCGWHLLVVRVPAGARRRLFFAAALALAIVLGVRTSARNQDYEDPLKLWTQVVEKRPHGRAHYNLGIALKERGQAVDALAHYRAAANDLPEAHYALGFEYAASGDHGAAVDAFRQFLSRAPIDHITAPRAHVLLGRSLAALGRFPEALASFNSALAMTPRESDAALGQADALAGMERWAEAADGYQRYVMLQPESAEGYASLGRMYIALEQGAKAIGAFERAVELEPRSPTHILNYGYALMSNGRAKEAEALYTRSLRSVPPEASIFSALGVALAAQGRSDEARQTFERALALDPANPQVREDMAMALGPRTR